MRGRAARRWAHVVRLVRVPTERCKLCGDTLMLPDAVISVLCDAV
jgi:hypothetical protein